MKYKVNRKSKILLVIAALIFLCSCKVKNEVIYTDNLALYGSLSNRIVKASSIGDEELSTVLDFREHVKANSTIKNGVLRTVKPFEEDDVYTFEECYLKNQCIKQDVENDKQAKLDELIDVAKGLVGYGGDCLYIASLFVKRYFGENHSIANIYLVDDPKPGDIIYYRNGGLGIEHWAVYLGENLSLQGNYNGRAIILNSIYLNCASQPIFYRVA